MSLQNYHCSKCNDYKPLSEFANRKTRKGETVKHSWCQSCLNSYKREWGNKKTRALRKYVFDYLSNNPCVDCGSTDLLVLEFDHKDPSTKSFNIGKAISGKEFSISLEDLISEIAKCEVMCRNCHQRKTHEENLSWRWLAIANQPQIQTS